jgi:hypothetical protein
MLTELDKNDLLGAAMADIQIGADCVVHTHDKCATPCALGQEHNVATT